MEELASVVTLPPADARDDVKRGSVKNVHPAVGAIRDVQKSLIRIG